MKKPKKEHKKDLSLHMNENEKSLISTWKKNDESLSPIKCVQNGNGLMIKTLSDRGSDQDKKDLIHAGLCMATGAKSADFGIMLLSSCLNAGGLNLDKMKKNEAEKTINTILDVLHSLKPSDEIEGMLVTKLISINFQISKFMNLSVTENQSIDGEELYINRSIKLSRLFNETLEALMRYRRKGEQKVIVQYVNVNDGGRAIVGNFDAVGGGGV